MQCCANVRATYRKQQTSQLWTEGTGNGCAFFCSLKLPHLSCRRLSESQEWPYIPKKINSTHFFMLGDKTHGGFLCQFDFIMPILEQLECGDFVIFSAWHFVSRLTVPWHRATWRVGHDILILSFIETHRNKEQSEKDRKLNRFLGIKVAITAKIAL